MLELLPVPDPSNLLVICGAGTRGRISSRIRIKDHDLSTRERFHAS